MQEAQDTGELMAFRSKGRLIIAIPVIKIHFDIVLAI